MISQHAPNQSMSTIQLAKWLKRIGNKRSTLRSARSDDFIAEWLESELRNRAARAMEEV